MSGTAGRDLVRRAAGVCGWLVLGCVALSAGVTPMDAELTEGGLTEIECVYQYTQDEANRVGSYSLLEHPMGARHKGVCHYQLYVPTGYHKEKEKKYGVVFIASSKAEPSMHNVEARAERDGWVVVMLTESKNEDSKWLGNFIGAHDDVMKRVRVIGDLKVATGSKGGGNCASVYGVYREGFRGYIGQGSCFWSDRSSHRYDAAKRNRDFAVYQVLGSNHISFRCRASVKRGVPKRAHHWSECLEGGETWAPTEAMGRAFDWVERKLFIEARTARVSKDAVRWHYENKTAALERARTPFEKYELMEYISVLAKKQRLTSDRAMREKMKDFKEEMKALGEDGEVKEELSARKMYWAIARSDSRGVDSLKKANPLITSYLILAAKYEDTVYGRKARERAGSLRVEFKVRVSGM